MRRLSRDQLALAWLVLLVPTLVCTACEELPTSVRQTGFGERQDPATSSTTSPALAGNEESTGTAGSSGIGDAYLPQAGNGGYDTLHYEVALTYEPEIGYLSAVTLIEAEALQDLGAFNLDLLGLNVESAEVDGTPADFAREGQELTIECPVVLEAGEAFSVEVAYFGVPEPLEAAGGYPTGWQSDGATAYTLDEPEGAATWYPVNDHPSDKATYTFRITVPKPYVATANGVLVATEDEGEEQTFVWEMRQPLANYLAAVAIGEFTVEEMVAPNGVAIRNYFDSELAEDAQEAFARTGEVLAYFSEVFGPYPFEAYGVVVPDVYTEAAMENQTLSLFGRDLLEGPMADATLGEIYLSHELAHQWFGDSVTLGKWQDIWLNEGFATYASWLWFEHDLGAQGLAMGVEDAQRRLGVEASSPPTGAEIPPGDPGVTKLFGVSVYHRGALTLHALRLTVGDDLFFSILREWVSRYRYGNATTEDFISLAQEKAGDLPGVDLTGLFDAWLFGETVPELPEAATAG